MEKKQTALMQAIEKLKYSHNFYVDEMAKDTYTDNERTLLYIKSIALGEAINDISELLPLEKEQIERDWIAGNLSMDERFKDRGLAKDPETYYNENYGE